MNIVEFLDILKASFPKMEQELGREMTLQEKAEIVKGAINKWTEHHPENWLVIPAEWNR